MIDRRILISGGLGLASGMLSNSRQAFADKQKDYEEAVRSTWAPLQIDGGPRELVRYATLAANSHNTQPWTFTISDGNIAISPDFGRRCPAVDPDDHHLFVSLGCATENLIQAASAAGLRAEPLLDADGINITLDRTTPERSALFEAIPLRQSARSMYDGKLVGNESLRLLEQAGAGKGVSIVLLTDRAKIANIGDFVIQANSAQMSDKAFMNELIAWLRFNETEAVATKDGLFSRTSGISTAPRWLAQILMRYLFTASGQNEKYQAQIQSSAGVAVFVSERNDRIHWIEAGRACQRFALQATALGMKCAFINQPVEVPAIRGQFATYLGIGDRRPDLVMRFGFGPDLPKSLRRPVGQVTGSIKT
jgi:nitroreductase